MKTATRYLTAIALLAALAACGNKGPLVKASPAPADAATSLDSTGVAPLEQAQAPPATEPVSAAPADVPPAGDGGGHG